MSSFVSFSVLTKGLAQNQPYFNADLTSLWSSTHMFPGYLELTTRHTTSHHASLVCHPSRKNIRPLFTWSFQVQNGNNTKVSMSREQTSSSPNFYQSMKAAYRSVLSIDDVFDYKAFSSSASNLYDLDDERIFPSSYFVSDDEGDGYNIFSRMATSSSITYYSVEQLYVNVLRQLYLSTKKFDAHILYAYFHKGALFRSYNQQLTTLYVTTKTQNRPFEIGNIRSDYDILLKAQPDLLYHIDRDIYTLFGVKLERAKLPAYTDHLSTLFSCWINIEVVSDKTPIRLQSYIHYLNRILDIKRITTMAMQYYNLRKKNRKSHFKVLGLSMGSITVDDAIEVCLGCSTSYISLHQDSPSFQIVYDIHDDPSSFQPLTWNFIIPRRSGLAPRGRKFGFSNVKNDLSSGSIPKEVVKTKASYISVHIIAKEISSKMASCDYVVGVDVETVLSILPSLIYPNNNLQCVDLASMFSSFVSTNERISDLATMAQILNFKTRRDDTQKSPAQNALDAVRIFETLLTTLPEQIM